MFAPFHKEQPVLILRLELDVGVLVEAHWQSAKDYAGDESCRKTTGLIQMY
jgi:hypothetical protein